MMVWNAEQYLRFGGQRLRPVLDLMAAIDLPAPKRVVDLGCGPGNATILLRERWPGCELTGLDNDPAMLSRARTDFPGEQWVEERHWRMGGKRHGKGIRPRIYQRGVALAAGSRGPVSSADGRAQFRRRTRLPDAAQFRRALAPPVA
jgi:SAM-dependent methyltransferase